MEVVYFLNSFVNNDILEAIKGESEREDRERAKEIERKMEVEWERMKENETIIKG